MSDIASASAVETYSQIMTGFFRSFDVEGLSNNEAAERFINYVYNDPKVGHILMGDAASSLPFSDLHNISIITPDTNIEFLTRRLLTIADTTLLANSPGMRSKYKPDESTIIDSTYDVYRDVKYYTNFPEDLSKLGYWLKSCRELLERGDLFYLPLITIEDTISDYGFGTKSEHSIESNNYIFDALVRGRKIVDIKTSDPVKGDMIKGIVQIKLPYIDNIALSDLSKVSTDEHPHLEKFRDFFREQFDLLQENEGSESFQHHIRKAGMDIKKGVEALESDYKRLIKGTAIDATGATLATTIATLVAVSANVFSALPPILGTGVMCLSNIVAKYVKEDSMLKDSPYFYLWLLRDK